MAIVPWAIAKVFADSAYAGDKVAKATHVAVETAKKLADQVGFARVADIRRSLPADTPIEVWFEDEMRVGQKHKLIPTPAD